MSKRRFRVLPLGSGNSRETRLWEDWVKSFKNGEGNTPISVFLTHEGYLRDIFLGKRVRQEIVGEWGVDPIPFYQFPGEVGGGSEPEITQPNLSGPPDSQVHLIAPFDEKQEQRYKELLFPYMGKLRTIVASNEECPDFSLFARGDFWSLAFQPEFGSQFLDGSGEFLSIGLLWDDGGLWEKKEWNEDDSERLKQAWKGSGWLETRFSGPGIGGGAFPYNDYLERVLNNNISALAKQLSVVSGDGEEDSRSGLIRRLCAFLPKVSVNGRFRTPFPNDPVNDPGKPVEFSDVADMNRLDRLMMFDGWLTLWPGKEDGRFWLQPASLAVLYWAAKKQFYAYTGNPEELPPQQNLWVSFIEELII